MKYRNVFVIVLINIFLVFLIGGTNIFGSTMDFLNQHIVFPEYLRSSFYETGKLIPSMVTMGGIENIYNIAYYGLLNPIVLFSYFLPFVKMVDYIVCANVFLLILSNVLFYLFIKDKFSRFTVFILSFLFMLSGPLIFQFHRHFMFVSYMPFLILAFINIDKGKKFNLIIDIILIILVSFYYSVGAIIAIILYYLYRGGRLKELIPIIFIPVLSTSVLTLPVLGSIFSTRTGGSFDFSLLIPYINIDNLLYGAYCPGLTSILIVSLVYLLLTKDRRNVFLVLVISVMSFFPFVLAILNGGLYARPKALIPFLPLLVYIIGIFIDDLFSRHVDIKRLLYFVFLFNLVVLIRYHVWVYYIDLFFTLVLIVLYNRTRIKYVLLPIVVLNFIVCICLNRTEDFISHEFYDEVSSYSFSDTSYRVSNLNYSNYTVNDIGFTPNIYSSTINRYYKNLYYDVFKVEKDTINDLILTGTKNVLFNRYMGVKYLISDDSLGYPYKRVDGNLYSLDFVLPIGYVNPNTVSRSCYEALEYPYNLDVFMSNIIVPSGDCVKSRVSPVSLDYSYVLGDNVYFFDGKIVALDDSFISVSINNDLSGKILFIEIPNQVYQDDDISLTINGQSNLLTKKGWVYPNSNYTFYYSIEGSSSIDVRVHKGVYDVSSIKTYVIDSDFFDIDDFDVFNITSMNSEAIRGNISVSHGGYFVLSIPYDKGFKISVNGSNHDYELINDSLIGFYIDKGYYEIEVTYVPPLLNLGKVLSVVGVLLFILERKRYEKGNSCFFRDNSNSDGVHVNC